MEFNYNNFSQEVIMGSPKVINGITFIPIVNVTFFCFNTFGFGFGGNISPDAFITIDKNGSYGFFKITDKNTGDLLKSIS